MTTNRFAPGPRAGDEPIHEDAYVAETSPSASGSAPAPSSSSSRDRPIRTSFPERTFDDADYDPQAALAAAKENAWYLDDADPSPSGSSPSSPSSTVSSTAGAPQPRQPVFTTFDADRTTATAPKRKIKPLPAGAPPALEAIHGWMTSKEAAFVLDPSSVRVMRTRDAGLAMTGEGEIIKVEGADGVGPKWEWIVTGVVRGKGKGIVGRAERALRLWVSRASVRYEGRRELDKGSG